MKLIGIESAPLDKTKKVLTVLNNLIKANNDFDNGFKIYDTYGHKVENCTYETYIYTEGWVEQTYYVTMRHSSGLYSNRGGCVWKTHINILKTEIVSIILVTKE